MFGAWDSQDQLQGPALSVAGIVVDVFEQDVGKLLSFDVTRQSFRSVFGPPARHRVLETGLDETGRWPVELLQHLDGQSLPLGLQSTNNAFIESNHPRFQPWAFPLKVLGGHVPFFAFD